MKTYNDGTISHDPEVIVCECMSSDHSIIYNKWDDPNTGKEVYLSFCMDVNRSFFKRLKIAFRYLFRREKYGSHGEIIITKNNVKGFKDIVDFLNKD